MGKDGDWIEAEWGRERMTKGRDSCIYRGNLICLGLFKEFRFYGAFVWSCVCSVFMSVLGCRFVQHKFMVYLEQICRLSTIDGISVILMFYVCLFRVIRISVFLRMFIQDKSLRKSVCTSRIAPYGQYFVP